MEEDTKQNTSSWVLLVVQFICCSFSPMFLLQCSSSTQTYSHIFFISIRHSLNNIYLCVYTKIAKCLLINNELHFLFFQANRCFYHTPSAFLKCCSILSGRFVCFEYDSLRNSLPFEYLRLSGKRKWVCAGSLTVITLPNCKRKWVTQSTDITFYMNACMYCIFVLY